MKQHWFEAPKALPERFVCVFVFITEPALKYAAGKLVVFIQNVVCKPILCFCCVLRGRHYTSSGILG